MRHVRLVGLLGGGARLALALTVSLAAACSDDASPPTTLFEETGAGHFGVTVRHSEIQVDIVLFEPYPQVSGSCNGVELGGHEDNSTSFVVPIAGGPLDPIRCLLIVDGAPVTLSYEPTAQVLNEDDRLDLLRSVEDISDYWDLEH